MPALHPLHFIGEPIEAGFDQPPLVEKKPGCPNSFVWRGQTYRIVEKLGEWFDYTRRGRFARNMQPQHAAVAATRGSWGVGRYYFQVRTEGGQLFELYYDRAPKGSDQRKGAWFLVSELEKEFRLVAFDLDNTLIGPDLTLSPRVKEAIARAMAQGVVVTIATGRGPSPTDQFAAALDLTAPLICFQGGIVYDYRAHDASRRVLHETRLDPAVVPIIVRLAEERGWNLQFETPDMIYLPRVSNHPAELLQQLLRTANWKRVDDFLTDLPETPHKFILSVHDRAERDALAAELRASFDRELAQITVVPSHPILVEGLPRGMSKAVGLAWLAEYLNISRAEVMAVGDNDNDAEMLRWAGLGLAMADGSPAALAAADETVPPVAEDGAAIALEKYVPQ